MDADQGYGPLITVPASSKHTATVILLHGEQKAVAGQQQSSDVGLGDSGSGFSGVARRLADQGLSHVKFLCPTAPTRPVTVNRGMAMSAWHDVLPLDPGKLQAMMRGQAMDPKGVEATLAYVGRLISRETAAGISASRIVIGGFSMGGHCAYKAALTHVPPLAGCVALSTWLEPSLKKESLPAENLRIPIFSAHGQLDNLPLATATQEVLTQLGCTNVTFKVYPGMAHSVCPLELRDLARWLLKVLPPETPPEPLPSREVVLSMRPGQLKALLQGRGVSTAGLLEKQDLLQAALQLLDPQSK